MKLFKCEKTDKVFKFRLSEVLPNYFDNGYINPLKFIINYSTRDQAIYDC